MKYRADRRDFLQLLMSGTAAATAFSRFAPAYGRGTETPIEVSKLNDQLQLFSGAGANVVAAHHGDGLALVDGGAPERSGELLKRIAKEMGTRRVKTLFNTHWHPDQTGSNEPLGKDGATIIGHENTKLWLEYANPVVGRAGTYGPLPPKARPSQTIFNGSAITMIGDEPVEYGYLLQAHTDGDIYVFFRKSNVLVTGGVVSGAGWPLIDYETGGWIVGLVDGIKTLASLANDDTRVVPANGPLLTRADLNAQHDMYSTISVRLQKMLRQGLGPDEAVAKTPTAEYDAKWGDPKQFVTLAFKSLWGHFAPDA